MVARTTSTPAPDASFVWRRLGRWLEAETRVAEAAAALAMADKVSPGCVPAEDFERLVARARAAVAEAGGDV